VPARHSTRRSLRQRGAPQAFLTRRQVTKEGRVTPIADRPILIARAEEMIRDPLCLFSGWTNLIRRRHPGEGEKRMDEWITFAGEAQALPWVRAVEVLLFSALIAKLVSLLISRFLLRLTLRTNTDLDDQLVQLLHRPVFVSVILIGFYIEVQILELSPGLAGVLISLIQTGAILVWTGAGFKLTSTTLTGLSPSRGSRHAHFHSLTI